MTKDKALEIALDYVLRTTYWSEGRDRHDTLKAIREAMSQPEPEYVLPGGGHVPPIPLTPPKREWVGLTDDEMQSLWDRYAHMEMMRAIEAKLKEKNL